MDAHELEMDASRFWLMRLNLGYCA